MAKPQIVLSTDTLPWYGLDYIFDIAKSAGFDWIDLAMWKNFDAWNSKYVKKLIKQYDLPVEIIQTSQKVTPKELQQAILLAQEVKAKRICMNAPTYFNVGSYKLIKDWLEDRSKQFPDIEFSIITPDTSSIMLLPIFPKYRFSSFVEVIKTYKAKIWLDTSEMDDDTRDAVTMRKLENMTPYISVLYPSDKSSGGKTHLPLGDGMLRISNFLQQLYKYKFDGIFSIKYTFAKKDLADADKIHDYLTKAIAYITKNFSEQE